MTQLSARSLSVVIGDKTILSGVDVALDRGQVTAIVGPNGAGKSTLLEHLAGIRTPTKGEVTLGDAAIGGLGHRERARRVGFLAQFSEVAWAVDGETLIGLGRLPYTGFGGAAAEDHAAVDRAVEAANVSAFRKRVVSTLSGGEHGRVLIARAIAGEPEWLLADEPMTGLDLSHQLDIGELFRGLAHDEGRGVVLTLHDLALAARIADRVLVMQGGRIVADGAPTQTLTADVFRQVYGVDARLVEGPGGANLEINGRIRS